LLLRSRTLIDHVHFISYSDFGDDTDQQLLLAQSLVWSGGVFNLKDFAKRLKDWSQYGLTAINKPPLGLTTSTRATITHPTFEQDPVSSHKKKGTLTKKRMILTIFASV
jgi:hypothetical protein